MLVVGIFGLIDFDFISVDVLSDESHEVASLFRGLAYEITVVISTGSADVVDGVLKCAASHPLEGIVRLESHFLGGGFIEIPGCLVPFEDVDFAASDATIVVVGDFIVIFGRGGILSGHFYGNRAVEAYLEWIFLRYLRERSGNDPSVVSDVFTIFLH